MSCWFSFGFKNNFIHIFDSILVNAVITSSSSHRLLYYLFLPWIVIISSIYIVVTLYWIYYSYIHYLSELGNPQNTTPIAWWVVASWIRLYCMNSRASWQNSGHIQLSTKVAASNVCNMQSSNFQSIGDIKALVSVNALIDLSLSCCVFFVCFSWHCISKSFFFLLNS